MGKLMKRAGAVLGLVVLLGAAAVVIVPMVVDVQKYKPEIEALVTERTGRAFSMGDDIKLSLFPWVGVGVSDLVLGNPKGFDGEEMISVKRFEVRIKVVPLLSRQIRVDAFLMDSPRIRLVRNRSGNGNWEGIGPAQKPAAEQGGQKETSKGGLAVASLEVGRFSITNGLVSFTDQAAETVNEMSGVTLELNDISLDRPVAFKATAKLDGHPLALSGTAGPIGTPPGKGDVSLELAIRAVDVLELGLKGTISQPAGTPRFDLAVDLAPFSPKQLFEALGRPFPVATADPGVLDRVALKADLKGSGQAVDVSGGAMTLDASVLTFSARARAFDKPDIAVDLDLDTIDLDRYLPRPGTAAAGPSGSGRTGNTPPPGEKTGADYAVLRKMVLEAKARIGRLKAANLEMANLTLLLKARNGVFDLDPFSVALYQGKAGATARVDVRNPVPATRVSVNMAGIQAGPMIRDAAEKDVLEGTLAGEFKLDMTGDTPDRIRRTLGGNGELTFTDGAVVGVDIAGVIRNAASGLGLTENPDEKPRTDFAELRIPYTAAKGVVAVPGASLASPLLRLGATGKTDLARETLDFRVDPKLVATLKGQGDTRQRPGLLIPLLITGTYANPDIRPDIQAILESQLPAGKAGLEKLLRNGGRETGGEPSSPEDKVKALIKGLFN